MVFMDAPIEGPGISVVRVNYEAGVNLAMQHLFHLQHREIAFLSGPLTLASARVREKAFCDAVVAQGIALNRHWIQEGDHRVEGGHRAMQRILQAGESRPTAVLTSNDLTAIGAMGAIHEAGSRIPEDISIIGFDGIERSAYTLPALTTMLMSRGAMAAIAFRSLLQYKDGSGRKLPFEEHVIEPRLMLRQSTAPPVRR